MTSLKLLLAVLLLYLALRAVRALFARAPASGVVAAAGASGAPQRRRWALALADILAQRNDLPPNADTLAAPLDDEARARLSVQVLRELDIPAQTAEHAITAEASQALRNWVRGLGHEQHDFYETLASEGRVRDALAFDCARTAFLVRCMALLGWVSDAQAWTVLLLNAQRAQDSFDSWADFGHAYARARQRWLALNAPGSPASHRAALEVQAHLARADSNWVVLPWNDWRIFAPEPA